MYELILFSSGMLLTSFDCVTLSTLVYLSSLVTGVGSRSIILISAVALVSQSSLSLPVLSVCYPLSPIILGLCFLCSDKRSNLTAVYDTQ